MIHDDDRELILAEFPDFDWVDDLPDTRAAGLTCMAWHNDTCPRFETNPFHALDSKDVSGWQVFIDYREPKLSEHGEGRTLYSIGWVDADGGYDRDTYSGNDWSEVLRVLAGATP